MRKIFEDSQILAKSVYQKFDKLVATASENQRQYEELVTIVSEHQR